MLFLLLFPDLFLAYFCKLSLVSREGRRKGSNYIRANQGAQEKKPKPGGLGEIHTYRRVEETSVGHENYFVAPYEKLYSAFCAMQDNNHFY